MPIKAGHGPSHSTDFNWPRLLPPTGPSQSGVSYIERRSVSNPGSHYRESSALPATGRSHFMTLFTASVKPIVTCIKRIANKNPRLYVFSRGVKSQYYSTDDISVERVSQEHLHTSVCCIITMKMGFHYIPPPFIYALSCTYKPQAFVPMQIQIRTRCTR